MSQKQITEKTQLLADGNLLEAGYSTHMNFVYDRREARGKFKEWDFYQILCGNVVLQLTVGHIDWCAQISANLIDLSTGKRQSVSQTRLNPRKVKRALGSNPETPNQVLYSHKGLKVHFETTPTSRRLTLSQLHKNRLRAEIDVILTNIFDEKDKMVIATPFDEPQQWYLNYKENCFVANGYARIDDFEVEIKDGNGVLDWGRGVWPRKHQWIWGNGSTVVDGKHFGFNIGWGFGNTSNATENMFFWDNKAYKLGTVQEFLIGDNYRYADEEKRFVFDVEPIFDNFTRTKAPRVDNTCHQVFGKWHGYVVLEDGTRVQVPPFVAFCEQADNNW